MNILLIDDHAVVRAGARRILTEAFPSAEFGEAGDAPQAVQAVRASQWDLIILDISLPGRSGLDVLLELRVLAPTVPVLVMTMYGEIEYAVRAFRNGAAGFLTKSSAAEELIEAARKVLSGGRFVTSVVAEHLAALLVGDSVDPLHAALSDREFQVLQLLAEGASIKEIGHQLAISGKTVSTYRSRLLEKMRMRTTADLIRYAHRAGLVA